METQFIMTYPERLKHWAIARLLPTQQWVVISRFYRRSDAEGHCQFWRQQLPTIEFRVVFDVGRKEDDQAE
jgi:hypothetical protein